MMQQAPIRFDGEPGFATAKHTRYFLTTIGLWVQRVRLRGTSPRHSSCLLKIMAPVEYHPKARSQNGIEIGFPSPNG
jgi:hypothetical protein